MDKTLLILRVERGREAQAGGVISLREFSRLQNEAAVASHSAASKQSCAGASGCPGASGNLRRDFRAAKLEFVAGLP